MSEDNNTCGCSCATASAEGTATEPTTYRRPHFTVTESAEAFGLSVFIPGVDKAGVEVAFADGHLSITARRNRTVTESWQALRQEIPADDYKLTLRVNVAVNEAGIAATVADGVLQVSLPKAEGVKPHKIEVR